MNEKGICQPAMATQMHKDRRKKEDVTSPKAGCRGQRAGHAAHAKNVVTTDEPRRLIRYLPFVLKGEEKTIRKKNPVPHTLHEKNHFPRSLPQAKIYISPKGLTFAYRRIPKAYEYDMYTYDNKLHPTRPRLIGSQELSKPRCKSETTDTRTNLEKQI